MRDVTNPGDGPELNLCKYSPFTPYPSTHIHHPSSLPIVTLGLTIHRLFKCVCYVSLPHGGNKIHPTSFLREEDDFSTVYLQLLDAVNVKPVYISLFTPTPIPTV